MHGWHLYFRSSKQKASSRDMLSVTFEAGFVFLMAGYSEKPRCLRCCFFVVLSMLRFPWAVLCLHRNASLYEHHIIEVIINEYNWWHLSLFIFECTCCSFACTLNPFATQHCVCLSLHLISMSSRGHGWKTWHTIVNCLLWFPPISQCVTSLGRGHLSKYVGAFTNSIVVWKMSE